MNLFLISPEITLFIGALTILMADVFFGKKVKEFFYISHLLTLIVISISLYFVIKNFAFNEFAFKQMFLSNHFTSLMKSIVLLLLSLVTLLSLFFVASFKKISAEFLALLLIATSGGMILISANDFITFYLSLELQALPLYLLAALNRHSPKSSEAGLKYFILGCLASGILLFGISMIYGFSGTTNFSTLNQIYSNNHGLDFTKIPIAVLFGFIMVLTAMFFKISAAPFHMWSPDVYEGSTPIVTTFFATTAKFTTIIALMELLIKLLLSWPGIEKIFMFIALTSIMVGSFGAIFQKNFKRLLAYSSIGHVGFILLAMGTFSKEAFAACILYAIIYAIISIGSFGFLILMKSKKDIESDEENDKVFAISALSGLAKTNPVMAMSLAILMFSTAGIPPLAGFFSKFYVIATAIPHGLLFPAIFAILLSVVSAYYYLRIVKIMYFDEAQQDMVLEDISNVKIVVLASAIFNLGLIFYLKPLFGLIINFLVMY